MFDSVYIFRTTAEIPGIFDNIFSGVFLALGAPMIAQAVLLTTLPLAILFTALEYLKGNSLFGHVAKTMSLVSFLVILFFLVQPWDELFVNLRHSLHFAEQNNFSFNRHIALEGTVDFLPYFLIGWLGKFGLPIVELSFIQSTLGGLLCLMASTKILKAMGLRASPTLQFVVLSFYAPLALNSANGFTATVFSANALWAIYFIFFSPRPLIGYLLLAVLPLIRIEGMWLVLLLWACTYPRTVKSVVSLILMGIPTITLSLWRLNHFGSMIPLPLQFKASGINGFHLIVGIRNLLADLVNSGSLACLCLLVLLLAIGNIRSEDKVPIRKGLLILVSFGLFVLPYYISGGDWLPRYWARYFLPFSLFSFIFTWATAAKTVPSLSPSHRRVVMMSVFFIAISQAPWYFSAYRKMIQDIFTHKKTMANVFNPKTGPTYHRIHHLSQLGIHLNKSSDPSDVIASSEVATIMFYARREALDLLGIANPEIVTRPVRLPPAIVRPFQIFTELPYLIFRRVHPDLIAKHQPEFIYTFDFFVSDLMPEVPFQELTNQNILVGLKRWEYKFRGLLKPLYGGVEKLLAQGYQPFVIQYANHFCTLYFVSARALDKHIDRLKQLNFVGGKN